MNYLVLISNIFWLWILFDQYFWLCSITIFTTEWVTDCTFSPNILDNCDRDIVVQNINIELHFKLMYMICCYIQYFQILAWGSFNPIQHGGRGGVVSLQLSWYNSPEVPPPLQPRISEQNRYHRYPFILAPFKMMSLADFKDEEKRWPLTMICSPKPP